MAYVRVGSCNHCGKCCLSMDLGGEMLENPCIDRGEDKCKFYSEDLNNEMYGHCLIYGRGSRPITVVRDSFHNRITQGQLDWFNDNCLDYPSAEDLQVGRCPPECSFSFEVV